MGDQESTNITNAIDYIIAYASLNISEPIQLTTQTRKRENYKEHAISKVIKVTKVSREKAISVLNDFKMNIDCTILYLTI